MANRFLTCTVFALIVLLSACGTVTPLEEVLAHPVRGNFQVGFQDLAWKDLARDRTIKVAVWYPSLEPAKKIRYLAFTGYANKKGIISGGRFPLIMMSHGTGGHRFNQFFIAEFLASHGYIVAAVEHPLNNYLNNTAQGTVANLWHRPIDVSFVIGELLRHRQFSTQINRDLIGFVGHSIGGYTGLVLAGAVPGFQLVIQYCSEHSEDRLMCDTLTSEIEKDINDDFDFTSLKDPRIKALFIMAPALAQAFDRENTLGVNLPIFITESGKDEVLPKPFNIDRYRSTLSGDVEYFKFSNAGHYVYIHECPAMVGLVVGEACRDTGTPRSEIHPLLKKLSLDFFNDRLVVQN